MTNVAQIGSFGIYNEASQASNLVDVLAPVGTIMAYNPGYYTAGSNAGFQIAGPASNTVAAINAFLPENWRVADGSALNNSKSPIWAGANRFLPDLTGTRFIRGSTAAGTSGGAASANIAHTHNVTSNVTLANHTLAAANIPFLSTSYTPAGTVDIQHTHGSSNVTYNKSDWNTNQINHFHTMSNGGSFIGNGGGSSANVSTGGGGYVTNSTTSGNIASWNNFVINGTAAGQTLGATSKSLSGTPATISVGNLTVTDVTHSVTNNAVTSGAASVTSINIVPQYLDNFYIIRVF